MKGYLKKESEKWFVCYENEDGNDIIISVYPDDSIYLLDSDDGDEIEFEIVRYCKLHECSHNVGQCTSDCNSDESKFARITKHEKSPFSKAIKWYKEKKSIFSEEISNDDIIKQSWEYEPRKKLDLEYLRKAFVAGAKWYREQINKNEK